MLISDGERDDLLWRSAMSGGTATRGKRHGKRREAQAGDISSIDGKSTWLVRDWYIEAKHYHDLQILRGLLVNTGRLYRFWCHTVREAKFYHKRPMLIAKQDRLPELVLVTREEKLGQIAVPVISLPGWNADVYLFHSIELLSPVPVHYKRVMIEEEEHQLRVLMEE